MKYNNNAYIANTWELESIDYMTVMTYNRAILN